MSDVDDDELEAVMEMGQEEDSTPTNNSTSNSTSVCVDAIDMDTPLAFHPKCGLFVRIINENLTVVRPNALREFNNAMALTNRPLKDDECFEVILDKVVEKWAGSLEIGLTTHHPHSMDFPTTVSNITSGTIAFGGQSIIINGVTIREDYSFNTDNLKVKDKLCLSLVIFR